MEGIQRIDWAAAVWYGMVELISDRVTALMETDFATFIKTVPVPADSEF